MKRDTPGRVVYSRDPNDPPFWPDGMSGEEMLTRLRALKPDQAKGAEMIIEDALRRAWGRQPTGQR